MKSIFIPIGIGLTVLCWGMYGPILHAGQHDLGNNRLKPLICVGLAYFIVAIILPTGYLWTKGELAGDWTMSGVSWSLLAGAAGAFGALGIIIALSSGGLPSYVMPLVFGCAPVVNAFVTILLKGTWQQIRPPFYAGLVLVALGAAVVLMYTPTKKAEGKPKEEKPKEQTAAPVKEDVALEPSSPAVAENTEADAEAEEETLGDEETLNEDAAKANEESDS